MNIKFNTHMQATGQEGFIAWIDSPKNFRLVVQGPSPEATAKELLISLKVKMARIFGVDIAAIQEKTFTSEADMQNELSKALRETGNKELQFQLA